MSQHLVGSGQVFWGLVGSLESVRDRGERPGRGWVESKASEVRAHCCLILLYEMSSLTLGFQVKLPSYAPFSPLRAMTVWATDFKGAPLRTGPGWKRESRWPRNLLFGF